MSKYVRHQSVISRQADEPKGEDHWYLQFQSNLQKSSVQPRGQNLFDEITSIMHGSRSKYPSVQAAVDDMMQRSGLTAYLDMSKTSEEHNISETVTKKVAHTSVQNNSKTPAVVQKKPEILRTLQNIIQDSKGNLPIPAIISRLHSMHANDISEESDWEDERLIRLVSHLNLQAKKDNPSSYDNYDNLGRKDYLSNSDIDVSNTDAFNILMPAKI